MTATLEAVRVDARVSNSLTTAMRRECACFSVSPLAAMLRTIGVEPIDGVEEYMAAELANAPPSSALGRFLYRRGYSEYPFDGPIKLCLLALCAVGVVAFVAGLTIIAHSWWLAGAGGALVAVSLGFWGEMVWGDTLIVIARGPAYWQTTSTEYMYEHRLPHFVRERMELVRQYIPEVRFKVADLRQDTYSLDPVLFAELADEQVTICIWKNREEVFLS